MGDSNGSPVASTTVIRGGRVIDPSSGIDMVTDVVVGHGRIESIGATEVEPGASIIDATGHVVVPGLIDPHVHTYGGIGPVAPDVLGEGMGVTALIDAGSAGSVTIDDLVALTAQAETPVRSILYVQTPGIGAAGYKPNRHPSELGSINIGEIIAAFERHGDVVCGIKGTAQDEYGPEWVHVTKTMARWAGCPAYFHLGSFAKRDERITSPGRLFDALDPGDVMTHIYTGQRGHILDETGTVYPEVRRAAERGVLFDIGFGRTGMSFDIAERAVDQGIVPTTISSDLQLGLPLGEGHDLLSVASSVLSLGFELSEVIAMMTCNVVEAFDFDPGWGTLRPGTVADISILRLDSDDVWVRDSFGQKRQTGYRLVPVSSMKSGVLRAADPSKIFDREHARFSLSVDSLPVIEVVPPGGAQLLTSVAALVEAVNQWDPEALHRAIRQAAIEKGLAWGDALRLIYQTFLGRDTGPQLGWWLISLSRRDVDVPARLRAVAGAL